MTTTAVDPAVLRAAPELTMLSPGELRAIVGRHELDLAHRPAGRSCQACALFAQAGGSARAVAIDGHLYFPLINRQPSGAHDHPTRLPSSESRTHADVATVRTLAEELSARDPENREALTQLDVRLQRVDAAEPLTDRTPIADAARLLLRLTTGDAHD